MSFFNRLFATKSLEQLNKEMEQDEGRLRRVLGPIGLTSLGIGAIIGAGIFVMTGRVAANNTGPAVMLSYCVAGVGCAFAAMCYAEFASMAPVAGSAYTYAYATLGELIAWIIGWDLILEYAMSAATVASAWSEYFNDFLITLSGGTWHIPDYLLNDPVSKAGAWFNLPAVVIMLLVTTVLVIGIRESAISNTVLVVIKLGVVLFVIAVGAGGGFIAVSNWTSIPPEERKLPQQQGIDDAASDVAKGEDAAMAATIAIKYHFGDAAKTIALQVTVQKKDGTTITLPVPEAKDLESRAKALETEALAIYLIDQAEKISADRIAAGKESPEQGKERVARVRKAYASKVPADPMQRLRAEAVLSLALKKAEEKEAENWGLFATLGLNKQLSAIDDKTRSNFIPYGLSGIMLGAALVFFAFIGFDSISTHAEEAIKPSRDVPIGIITSLVICTVLYIGVSAVITGMKPYHDINVKAAVSSAFRERAEVEGGNTMLKLASGLIALGGLAGMTSVLLITLLSQARIFLAMSRDGFMPKGIFGAVHAKFKTPHVSTIVTGIIVAVVAAFTPIGDLEKMVNIGTLFAFVVVCGAVLILRIKRPEVKRPFRCPMVFVLAPLGIMVNVMMMLFLPPMTWARLVVWLILGLVIYFAYGYWNSALAKREAAPPA